MKRRWILPLLLLAVFSAQAIWAAWDNGQTVDETFYNGSAYPMVRYNDYHIVGEHPPLMMQLGALPLLFLQLRYDYDPIIYIGHSKEIDVGQMGSRFLYESGNDAHLILFLERLSMIAVTVLAGFVLFLWSSELFGFGGGVLSLALFSFSPDMIGHGSIFMTDIGVTTFFFIALYRLKKFFDVPSARNGALVGIFSGLALMSKMSALLLCPIFFILFILLSFIDSANPVFQERKTHHLDVWLMVLAVSIFVLSTTQKMVFFAMAPLSLGVLWLMYPKGTPAFRSPLFSRLTIGLILLGSMVLWIAFFIDMARKRDLFVVLSFAGWLLCSFYFFVLKTKGKPGSFHYAAKIFALIWFIATLVIVFGYTDFIDSFARLNPFHGFVRAFNIAAHHSLEGHTGHVPGSFVIPGKLFFLLTMLVKSPVTSIVLFIVGLCAFPFLKLSRADKAILLIPPVFFFLFASFINDIFISVRHVLPVYPFLFLIAGPTYPLLAHVRRSWIRLCLNFVLGILMAIYVGRAIWIAPHQLSQFSEFVGDAEQGAKLLHVNMWQDNKRLAEVVRKHQIPHIVIGSISNNPAEYKYYGMDWSYMKDSDFTNPSPGFYALDLGSYMQQQRDPNSWFRNRKPLYKAGKTIYVFEAV